MLFSIAESEIPEGLTEAQLRSELGLYLYAKAVALGVPGTPLPIPKYDLFAQDLMPGFVVIPTPLPELITTLSKEYEKAVNAIIQVECANAGFDNIQSASDYAATDNPLALSSASFINWRAAVWIYCRDQLALVEAGTIPIPDLASYLASLPVRIPPSEP